MNQMNLALSKTNLAYDYLKEGLKSGKWEFGDEISVVEIANKLGFSRRPVIDALKKLEAEYFVEIIPQTGCRVRKYSQDEMYDHFLTVMALEGMAAYLAAQRREDHEVKQLYAINEELRKVVEENFTTEKYFQENQRLHSMILQMSKSKKLFAMTQSQWDLSDFFLVNTSLFQQDLSRTIFEHEMIIEKIADKDAAGARTLMENHIQTFASIVKKYPDVHR
ncbi:MAG: GntR family transcriptional regulator [Thermicanus sp.]|nr:GntR family transcriptional regulator [Thermicanus sp.]